MSLDNPVIEIKPIGSYFEIDTDGHIINPASLEKIPEKYKKLLEDTVEIYKKICGNSLVNVYVRGSVAKGQAVDFISDIDTLGFVQKPVSQDMETYKETIKAFNYSARTLKEDLEKKFNFVKDIEINIKPLQNYEKNVVILSQALCIYGEPFTLPKLKPGRETMQHTPAFERMLLDLEEFYLRDTTPERNQNECSWVMKRLLRIGFEITMERSKRYTRDLYKCYETFSEYYPEKEPQMKEILFLALNPTSDKNKIKEITDNFGRWLLNESKGYL